MSDSTLPHENSGLPFDDRSVVYPIASETWPGTAKTTGQVGYLAPMKALSFEDQIRLDLVKTILPDIIPVMSLFNDGDHDRIASYLRKLVDAIVGEFRFGEGE